MRTQVYIAEIASAVAEAMKASVEKVSAKRKWIVLSLKDGRSIHMKLHCGQLRAWVGRDCGELLDPKSIDRLEDLLKTTL